MTANVIRAASLRSDAAEFLQLLGTLNGSGDATVQAFNSSAIASERQLLAAYENAKARFSNKTNRTRSVQHEMLLFVALTNQINEAIKRVGVGDRGDVVVFASTKAGYFKVAKSLKSVKAVPKASRSDMQLLQKMALLQVEGN